MNIGPIKLVLPFCQAGLAGYSDRAMRLVARRRGCPYAVTEALLDTIMLSGGQGLKKSIDINDEDHPVAGQIIGADPDTMARAARILHDNRYDVIDLNFACPVKKIKSKGRGGNLLLDVERGLAVLREVRRALPSGAVLTASLRRGYDDSAQSVDRFFRLADEAWSLGFSAVRVHGRSVEQKYQGRANWDFLRRLKEQYPGRTIIGSGDVFSAGDAVRMLSETKVDIVWIARGAIGNPWIFQQAAQLLTSPNQELIAPSIAQQRDALHEHFALAMQIHGEAMTGRRMRKMGIKYARFHPEATQVKANFIDVHSLRDWQRVLDRWYNQDAPGVWPAPDAADEVNEPTTCEGAADAA